MRAPPLLHPGRSKSLCLDNLTRHQMVTWSSTHRSVTRVYAKTSRTEDLPYAVQQHPIGGCQRLGCPGPTGRMRTWTVADPGSLSAEATTADPRLSFRSEAVVYSQSLRLKKM